MKIQSPISLSAVLSHCKLAFGFLILLMAWTSSFAQEPPLVPRTVFDAPAEHDCSPYRQTEKLLPIRRLHRKA